MKKYIAREIKTVEAEQWLGIDKSGRIPGVYSKDNKSFFVITIHEQATPIEIGDYIIKEPVQNNSTGVIYCYPCRADIFEATYKEII